MAVRLGLSMTGNPTQAPPPVVEVWLHRQKTAEIVGTARFAARVSPTEIELDYPLLFSAVSDETLDVVIQSFEGAWTSRGLQGRHHVVRADPVKLLREERYNVALPDDLSGSSARLRIKA